MTATADRTRAAEEPRPPRLPAQWAGLLLAPAAFLAHLEGAYVLVPRACRDGTDVWLHVVGVASVGLAAAGAWIGWRVWSAAGRGGSTEPGGELPRARFLGAIGFAASALLVLLLAVQWLVAFVIDPCQ